MTFSLKNNITYSKDLDMLFVDIAGFGDTDGEMVDLINCFTDKFLFMNTKSIRFILPMTVE